MRKTLLSAILFLAAATFSFGQAANPQNTFASAVNVNSPSLWLNYNDATTAFKDSVSGLSFASGTITYNGTIPSGTSGGNGGGTIGVNAAVFSSSGPLNYIYFQAGSVPSTTQTFLILSGTAPSLTIVGSFTATVAATAAAQLLVAGVNFTAPTVTAGERLGNWVASGTSVGYQSSGTTGVYYLTGKATLPSGAQTYSSATGAYMMFGGFLSNTATARQPGFDNTNNTNYSAEFPYNSSNLAPNTTLGSAMEWYTPWTMLLHINKLNWDHTGKYVLASKGDLNSTGINNIWWQLYIQQNSGNASASQLCFSRQGPAPYTAPTSSSFAATQTWCSPTVVDSVPNTFNYDVIVEDNGTGGAGAISMWINGLNQSLLASVTNQGFGGLTIAVTAPGTGYTSAPTIVASGGGANCTVKAAVSVSGGAVTGTNNASYGCTSAPSLTLTGGGGSGAVLTATAYPMTMNSPTQPLMVPGYVNAGIYYGSGGTDTAENPLYLDEFAEFPGNLSPQAITNIFNQTKFYQNLVFPGLTANPPLVIFNSYGCGSDFSGDQTMAMLIGAHQAGLIRLIGIDDDDNSPNGSNSAGWFRQMLDQAGLADVPVAVGTNAYGPNLGGCPAANITAYNANTDQNPADYESATTMFRTLFARYPSTPIYVLMTQTATGYNAFQLSPADSISPLTGLQLQQQNYNNGGWVNGSEGNFGTSPAAYLSVLNNMGPSNNLPIYFEGGGPAQGGPGIYNSRTSLDPLYQAAREMGGGTDDYVTGWTNQNLAQIISPYFNGGAQITVSGGTGYATVTPLTSVGGGPNCNVTALMVSSGGVPASFVTPWNGTIGTTYNGYGYGCAPAVFTATGSGTNLTVSAITCCKVGNTPPVITIGDTISGAGIPTGTTLVSQTSGTPGGVGVYVTSVATTASAATVTRQPTIVLTAPTGTGATFSVTTGIFIKAYEGSATASYAVWPNVWANAAVFTWFQNSLMNPPTTGLPRSY